MHFHQSFSYTFSHVLYHIALDQLAKELVPTSRSQFWCITCFRIQVSVLQTKWTWTNEILLSSVGILVMFNCKNWLVFLSFLEWMWMMWCLWVGLGVFVLSVNELRVFVCLWKWALGTGVLTQMCKDACLIFERIEKCLNVYDNRHGCLCPCIRGLKVLVLFFKGVGVLACLWHWAWVLMSLYKGTNLMLLSFLKGVGVLTCLWH